MKQEQPNRSKLFDRQPTPVATDIFLHNLDPGTLEALHEALAQGLIPSGLDFTGDDGSIAILRLSRSHPGLELPEAHSRTIDK